MSPPTHPYPLYRDSHALDVDVVRAAVAALDLEVGSEPTHPRRSRARLRPLTLPGGPRRPEVTIIRAPWAASRELNDVTDFFSEKCRVQCSFLGHPSPATYWDQHRDEIVRRHRATKEDIREIMYMSTRMCNNFRISVAITVLRMFRARRWLDISAGWGDRLIAALLTESVERYCGVDPNPCLHPVYTEMIRRFDREPRRKRYVLIEGGFENARLPAGQTYDLVFTSPPFFDLETYSDGPADSLVAHKRDENRWYNGFLLPSLRKAHDALEPGGHMVLYIGESRGTSYVRRARSELGKLMKDCGSLYYEDGKVIREFFVWRKMENGGGIGSRLRT